ncbi:hypothetical protein A3L04_05165 [Thermococcus chitonophagus]|uniref:Uncharacterized protein n=1 Tax=Thermococcus chitonophagus TaxID=54262 RepID=A0A160VRI3_9EURY|nr:hypothetical protein [Thermococcus chitonophagus]ASJ16505.1 hypothetical protein A3L04_05165 [Thermococcus chitonophagus]CUX77593.1 hypothetical protein CHITON_0814 [Thermococcus chitonophagus]
MKTEDRTLFIIGVIAIGILTLIFLDMLPVYFRTSFIIGITLIGLLVVNGILSLGLKFGYRNLLIINGGMSVLVLVFMPSFRGINIGGLIISWKFLAFLYLLITLVGIWSKKEEETEKLKYIAYPLLILLLILGVILAYGGLKFQVPPDAIRGIAAKTKIKTWRAMGILFGLLNCGAIYSIYRGRYIAYILFISFILPPLLTVPLAIREITFGTLAQVLFLVQVYLSGVMISWYMGLRKL